MRLILDTNVFLWIITGDTRLSENAQRLFLDQTNDMLLSMASVWEIFIQTGAGKLRLPEKPEVFLRDQLRENLVSLLPIRYEHCAGLLRLPNVHRDPFDRLIIAQALHERLPVLSADPAFVSYGVENRF